MGQEISGSHLVPGEFSQGMVSACSSTELLPTSAPPPPSPGLTVPHSSARAIVSPPVDPQIWKGRMGGLSWLLGRFPTFFFRCKSQIFLKILHIF